jgi:hypothetical protein
MSMGETMTTPNDRSLPPPSPLHRFFGGSPVSVIFRLILLSILVGVILKVLGLDPRNILRSIEDLVRSIWNMGFDAVLSLWRYFALGALVVVPIWLVVRLVRAPQGR